MKSANNNYISHVAQVIEKSSSDNADVDLSGALILGFDEQTADDGSRYSKVFQWIDGDWEESWVRVEDEDDSLPVPTFFSVQEGSSK